MVIWQWSFGNGQRMPFCHDVTILRSCTAYGRFWSRTWGEIKNDRRRECAAVAEFHGRL
jgi:hypothetical protein